MGARFGEQPLASGGPTGGAGRTAPTWLPWAGGGAALVVVALVAGIVIWTQSGGSSVTGASSPEDAVKATITAIEARDPARAVELTPPEERSSLGSVVSTLASDAAGTGAAPSDDPVAALSGLDVTTSDVTLQTESIRDDLATVTITSGSAQLSADPAQVNPEARGKVVPPDAQRQDGTVTAQDLTTGRRDGSVAPFAMAVKTADGWFVSPLYTMLEYAVQVNGVSRSNPGAVQTQHYDSPEAAVRASADAAATVVTGGSIDAFARTLTPYEAKAVLTYGEGLAREIDPEYLRDASVESANLRSEDMGGGVARVRADQAQVRGSDRRNSAEVSVSGTCATTKDQRQNRRGCLSDIGRFGLDPVGLSLLAVARANDAFVVARNDNGWHLSISGTYFGTIVNGSSNLDGSELALIRPELGSLAAPDSSVDGGGSATVALRSTKLSAALGDEADIGVVELTGSKDRSVEASVKCDAWCSVNLVVGGRRQDSDSGYSDEPASVSGEATGSDARLVIYGSGSVQVTVR